jgi:hypothetical protein
MHHPSLRAALKLSIVSLQLHPAGQYLLKANKEIIASKTGQRPPKVAALREGKYSEMVPPQYECS